ncbi:cytochrome P450 4A6, putative [gamma proteobacterium HTCC5015]|nr:cytochrome P450 4A6, putative [gamma proteobacterium HTCC5015]
MTDNTAGNALLDPPLFQSSEQTAVDIGPNQTSFPLVKKALSAHPDICRLPQKTRKGDAYLINKPEFVKNILVNNHPNYHKGAGFELVKMLMGNGIIVLDGDIWKRHKKMIQPGFHRRFVAQLTTYMEQSNRELAERWESLADSGEAFDLTEAMNELSLRIILRALFSRDFERMLEEHGGGHPFSIFSEDLARDLKLVARFRGLGKEVQAIIDRRRAEQREEVDFLSVFMNARDENGDPMSDKELIDEVMTLIVAGHETGANTLNWCWYLLSQNPDKTALLHREIDDLAFPEFATFEDLPKLAYTEQVLNETLRLYPAVWLFSRKALGDDSVGDYRIPAGADVFLSPWFIQRRADLWPEPEAFIPERFDKSQPQYGNRYSFIPFSGGPRRCIGDFFGMVEMQLHLAYFARRYELVFDASKSGNVDIEPEINLRSAAPIYMRLKKRRTAL